MVTWGTGYFEDDYALDFRDGIDVARAPKGLLEPNLEMNADAGCLLSPPGLRAV